MKKTGALNLSIEVIIVVVIAFVVLGLGLTFVREQFGNIGDTTTAVQEQIEQQILDTLRTGDKKLSFPTTQLTLETAAQSVQAIGMKNTADEDKQLQVEFYIKAGNSFQKFTSEQEGRFTTANGEIIAQITWDDSVLTFNPGEARVIPVTITAPDKTGNYLYKVVILDIGLGEVFDERTFFIKAT